MEDLTIKTGAVFSRLDADVPDALPHVRSARIRSDIQPVENKPVPPRLDGTPAARNRFDAGAP